MKIAYLLNNKDNMSAIEEKAVNLINALKVNGFQTELIILKHSKIVRNEARNNIKYFNYSNGLQFIFIYYRILFYIIKKRYKLIYTRGLLYMPGLFLIHIASKIIYEINANEIEEFKILKRRNLYHHIKYYYKVLTREILYRNCAGFVTVTNELLVSLKKYRKPSVFIPNSIDMNNYYGIRKIGGGADQPVLFFIGSPSTIWHGVDKIMNLAKGTNGLLKFNIVGINDWQGNLYDNVKFWGYLPKKEWLKIAVNSDIAISSLALHRENINEACPLKSRYYLAVGLPIIAGYHDPAFGENTPDYILELDNNEKNVSSSFNNIVDFCYTNKHVIVPVSKCIHHIDSSIIEKKRIEFILKIGN